MNFPHWVYLVAQLFSIFVGIISLKKNSVSTSGLTALLLMSSAFIWMDQIPFLITIFLMFASSSLLTKFQEDQKKEFKEVVAKTGSRDYVQAICNLGVATAIMLLYYFSEEGYLVAAFMGSVAAANADSWASEIGGLSKRQPVMITNFKPVAKGISGGVTAMGIAGGVAGSFFISSIGTLSLLFNQICFTDLIQLFLSSFLAGIIGFNLDSYLGAWFQALYINKNNNNFTENPLNGNLKKGIKWIDNDVVNLITTVAGGFLAGIFYKLF